MMGRGRILKVIPGMNANSSSGMFAMAVLVFAVPLNLFGSLLSTIIFLRRPPKGRGPMAGPRMMLLERLITDRSFIVFLLLTCVLWGLQIADMIQSEGAYTTVMSTWIEYGVMVSIPSLALILSMFLCRCLMLLDRPRIYAKLAPFYGVLIGLILWFCMPTIGRVIRMLWPGG